MRNLTRRKLMTTAAGSAAALAFTGGAIGAASANMAARAEDHIADCSALHETLGHRLGALVVDPALSEAQKAHAIKKAACPNCGTGIAPSGLAFGKHMWS